MLNIFLSILGYWVGMGVFIAGLMWLALRFAIVCEQTIDLLFYKK
jgi:hypothetical protein